MQNKKHEVQYNLKGKISQEKKTDMTCISV